MGVLFPGDEFAFAPGGVSRLKLSRREKAAKVPPAAPITHSLLDEAPPASWPAPPPVPSVVAPPQATTIPTYSVGGAALATQLPATHPADDPVLRHRPMRSHLRALAHNADVAPAPVVAEPATTAEPVPVGDTAKPARKYRVPALLAAVVVIVAGVAFVVGTKTRPAAPARAAAKAAPAEVAAGEAAPVAKPITFADTFQVGAERSYTMTLSGSSATTLTLKVAATMEDGSALVDLTAGEDRARLTVSPDGRVASVDGEAGPFGALADPVDQTALQMLFVQLPGKAVKTGDTWGDNDFHAQIPGTDQVVAVNTSVTDNGGTANDAKLSQVVDVPVDLNIAGEAWSGTLHMTSTLHVVPSTGEVTKLSGTVVQHLTNNGTPLDATLKITLTRSS